MSLDIGQAIREGLNRLGGRSGRLLLGLFVIVRLIGVVGADTATQKNRELLETTPGLPAAQVELIEPFTTVPTPFAIPVSLPMALGLLVIGALIAEATRIVAIRTFASAHTDGVPGVFFRHRIGWATINGFLGGIVVFVLIGFGLVLLLVPGLFVAVAFYFVRQEIAVEDLNFVEAMERSWERTRGNRLELFILALLIGIVNFAAGLTATFVDLLGPLMASSLGVVASAITTTFGVAVASRAYVQLRAEPTEPDEPETLGALGPEELDEWNWDDP